MADVQAQTEHKVQSRTGKRPVALPKGVTVAVANDNLDVQGPKGKLSRKLPDGVVVQVEGGNALVTSDRAGRDAARLQGLVRALLAAMVKGASEGYTRTMELRGTGYRAELKGTTLHFALGLSHPVAFALPPGIKAYIPADSKGTLIVLTSSDKELLGQAAATIRGFRPPEPYAGKGVRYQGEKVREKAGKAGKGGKGGK